MYMPRQYVQRFEAKEIEGVLMTLYVTKDMTDQEISEALPHFLEQEEYEYCAALTAELASRGLIMNNKGQITHFTTAISFKEA